VLLRGLKLILKIARTRPLQESMDAAETDSFLDQDMHKLDDAALAEVVKSRVETLYHPCSTARMAPLKDGGVVDPYLRVHGIPNLRVVDASVFPTIVSGHTVSVWSYGYAPGAQRVCRPALYLLSPNKQLI
jgi:choline dehydrogenase